MNRTMTKEQFQLLLQRNRIENVWSVMKLNYNLIYHRARSVTGMFRHFFYSISAFLFHLVEDAKQWFLPSLQTIAKLEFWPFVNYPSISAFNPSTSKSLSSGARTASLIYCSPQPYFCVRFFTSRLCSCKRFSVISVTDFLPVYLHII